MAGRASKCPAPEMHFITVRIFEVKPSGIASLLLDLRGL
jgi:hypothetical protein